MVRLSEHWVGTGPNPFRQWDSPRAPSLTSPTACAKTSTPNMAASSSKLLGSNRYSTKNQPRHSRKAQLTSQAPPRQRLNQHHYGASVVIRPGVGLPHPVTRS